MREKNKKNKKIAKKVFLKKDGFIAIYLLIAISVTITLLTGLIVFVSSSQRRSSDNVSRNQALEISEVGIYNYKWYLAHSLDGKNAQQIKEFWQAGNARGVSENYEQEINDFYGEPIGKYEISVDPPDPESTIISVTSTGWNYRHPHIKKSVKVRFRRPSWCEYSVAANDVMRFGSGTNVYGPIHSNSGIRFDGVAHNQVTSAVETYRDPDTGITRPGVWTSQSNEENVFLAGKDFPVPAIDFNGITTDLSYIKEEAIANGLYFGEQTYEGESCRWRRGWFYCGRGGWCYLCETTQVSVKGYHLTLRSDDKIEVRRVLDYEGDYHREYPTFEITDETDVEVFDFPTNGAIYVNNHVWVDGEIDTARLTIAAADLDTSFSANIYLLDDILYTNKDGQDILGLIAEEDVTVGLYSENNLEIDAALLAQNGRVGRQYYDSTSYRWRDTITVFGSIVTKERYGFAYTDGTGYDTRNLYFDNNLLYYPPPFFPTGTVYELDLWEDL